MNLHEPNSGDDMIDLLYFSFILGSMTVVIAVANRSLSAFPLPGTIFLFYSSIIVIKNMSTLRKGYRPCVLEYSPRNTQTRAQRKCERRAPGGHTRTHTRDSISRLVGTHFLPPLYLKDNITSHTYTQLGTSSPVSTTTTSFTDTPIRLTAHF